MIKIIELTKNHKLEFFEVDFVIKDDDQVVANVKNKYRCEITTPETGWDSDTKAKVFCSCPDFQFRWAYVLWKHDALLHPNNFVLEPPKEKNPGMRIGACKHLAAVARKLLENEK